MKKIKGLKQMEALGEQGSVPDHAENDKIIPVETKETIFLAEPRDSESEEHIHKQLTDSAISYRIARDFIQRTASRSRNV